jgi:serine protease Do
MLPVVKRSLFLSASVSLACVAAPALAQGPSTQALPSLPGPSAGAAAPAAGPYAQAPADAQNTPAANALPTPQQLYEHVRRGVVAIERNGVPMAIGTVLGGDGRILTALSGLGGAEGADVRYADGTTVHAKVGHSDKETDLALLIPQSRKWTDGLSASEANPIGADLRAILPAIGKGVARLGPAEAGVKGQTDAHARDGGALPPMLDVDLKGLPIAGAPLLDSTGSVVGVLVRACKGPAPQAAAPADSPWAAWAGQAQQAAQAATSKTVQAACNPVVLGAPVAAIRNFLVKTPATAVAPSPWLGIRGEADTSGTAKGVRVMAVAPQSPAEKSGLKPNSDVIVAVDGQAIESPEKLADAIGKHAPGETVKLLVYGEDKFREVQVALRAAP